MLAPEESMKKQKAKMSNDNSRCRFPSKMHIQMQTQKGQSSNNRQAPSPACHMSRRRDTSIPSDNISSHACTLPPRCAGDDDAFLSKPAPHFFPALVVKKITHVPTITTDKKNTIYIPLAIVLSSFPTSVPTHTICVLTPFCTNAFLNLYFLTVPT